VERDAEAESETLLLVTGRRMGEVRPYARESLIQPRVVGAHDGKLACSRNGDLVAPNLTLRSGLALIENLIANG
jgi:hypothetical protein